MLVSNKDAKARLDSSNNLLNMLRTGLSGRKPGMNLFKPAVVNIIEANPGSAPVETPPVFVNPFRTSALFNPLPTIADDQVIEPEVLPPTTDDILGNADAQIQLAQAHDKALKVLVKAVDTLHTKLDDVKPEKLATVITATAKVVESIRKEKIEAGKSRTAVNAHFHFYEPKRKEITDYEVIEA